jgi:ABC-type multidrug transport system ATPase subunit
MKISLSDIGKRFNREWIFRHCTYTFGPGGSYAITGPNGSGKSTVLQIIAGALIPSEGSIAWHAAGPPIDPEKVYAQMSLAAPYLEVIEEMTLPEFLSFHAGFKPWIPGVTIRDIIHQIGLEAYPDKQIRYFSSGMKQRVKLAQAIFSDTSLLLLDEPCTNLDKAGYALYHRLIDRYAKERLVIVSSNDPAEYDFCRQTLHITDFKATRHHAGNTQ